ncbi:UDP-N-acetylglucosamine--dolichyl-phosphate N-acetylglucosaminephosphotransferase [Candidatus Micrarchaeota archaeon]|nr:UDP-N-acetylglucosamine--dolichyl-phosphate N-acetylglucosaminephosphotransferase [Candidatus Micrarchaeota archaeon]
MSEIIWWLLPFILAGSFLTALITTKFVIFNSKRANIVGTDKNKVGELVPEMGGIAVVAGTSLGILIAIALGFNFKIDIQVLLAAISTVVIMGILGIIDDLYSLKQKIKAPIPFIAAIPLSAVRAGPTRTVSLPFLDGINFGSFYPLVIVPLGVGGASNAFNMLAGLNGLEAGMGAIISLAIFIAAFMKGSFEAMIISLSLFSACIAFLIYNKFPAKVFPGDVGTYTIGGTIACAVIVGNLEFFGLVLFAPYFLEFLIKARNRFRGQNYGELKNGILHSPKKPESLTHYVMKLAPMSEGKVVAVFWIFEIALSTIALLFFVY